MKSNLTTILEDIFQRGAVRELLSLTPSDFQYHLSVPQLRVLLETPSPYVLDCVVHLLKGNDWPVPFWMEAVAQETLSQPTALGDEGAEHLLSSLPHFPSLWAKYSSRLTEERFSEHFLRLFNQYVIDGGYEVALAEGVKEVLEAHRLRSHITGQLGETKAGRGQRKL